MSGDKRFDLETQGRLCALCPNMCRFLCPVWAAEKVETVSPRGKATLAGQVNRGELRFDPAAAEVFYHCAGCKVCREWCPSNVDLPEVTAGLRERAAGEGLAPRAASALRERLLRERSPYRAAAEAAPSLRPYRDLLATGAKVLYFAGCLTAARHPDVVAATLRLFEAAGVGVSMLEGEECCGLPLDALGFRDDAAAFAGNLARAVAAGGYETVVSGCPMCTYVLKERYPALGAALEAEVKHVTEYLVAPERMGPLQGLGQGLPAGPEVGPPGGAEPLRPPGPRDGEAVTYQDPCYLGRLQGVYDAPRRLLAEAARLRLVEMDRSRDLAACCGGAPATAGVTPNTATAMAGRRVEDARRTGAGTLVTACPHCLEMLAPANEAAAGPTVRDITVVLADVLTKRLSV